MPSAMSGASAGSTSASASAATWSSTVGSGWDAVFMSPLSLIDTALGSTGQNVGKISDRFDDVIRFDGVGGRGVGR